MKLSLVYSGGTYRGIQLAKEFYAHDCLESLFIPFYSRKHKLLTKVFSRIEDKQEIDSRYVHTNIKVCAFRKALLKTQRMRNASPLRDRAMIGKMIAKWVANKLDGNTDALLVESHCALEAMQQAKSFGMTVVLDRQAANIEFQEKIMSEEYAKYGYKYRSDVYDIERAVQEYEKADYIIVPSSFVQDTFQRTGVPKNKIIKIMPGIDFSFFRTGQRVCNYSKFIVIYCGGILLGKGVQYLLEAFRSLSLENAELWLVGNVGSEMKNILKSYDGMCKVFGYVPNCELSKYYAQADVIVLPSLQDSFGKVIVEAMACGVPAIVSENTGVKDIIQDGVNGYIVPIRDSKAISAKLMALCGDKEMGRYMGENARLCVTKRYGIERYANNMLDEIKRMLNVNKTLVVDSLSTK